MTLFRRRRAAPEQRFGQSAIPPPGAMWTGTGTAWATPVSTEQALRLSSVWASHNLICDQVAALPVDEFRKMPDKSRVELAPSRLILEPSAEVDAMTWRYQAVSSMLLAGSAVGLVTGVGASGWPEQIELIDSHALEWTPPAKPGGPWTTKLLRQKVDRWPEGPLWYLPGRTLAGSPVGLSVIAYAASRIGMGLGAERFGSDWFDSGGHPSGILQSDQEITRQVATDIKERFVEATRSRQPVAMGLGLKYQPISVPANESQFLETIQASVSDVARFFGLQPEMIGGASSAGSSLTYANIEQRFLHLRQITLEPWVRRLEMALTALTPRPRYIKFNRDAAVAMDLLTRVKAMDIQVRNETLLRNEARGLDDRPPLPGGDEPGLSGVTPPPANEGPTGQDAQGGQG